MNVKKTILPLVLGVVCFMVIVWLIRSEGARFRRSMRESAGEAVREGISGGAGDVVEKAGVEVKDVITTAADQAERVIDAVGEVIGNTPAEEIHTPAEEIHTPAEEIQETTDPVEDDSNPTPDEPAEETPSADKQPLPKPPSATDAIGTLFDLGRDLAKTVDDIGQEVFALDIVEERKHGRDVHELIERQHTFLDTPALLKRIEKLATPVLDYRARKGLDYSFFVIDAPDVNAFSHLGGYVYLNRGLLELAKTDAELQFVLAHEIAHVDLKHCVGRLTYAARAAEIAGEEGADVVQHAYHLIALGYAEEDEFEADAWGYRVMQQLDHTPEDGLAFHRRMLAYEREQGISDEPQEPATALDAGVQEIENHFRSHPPMAERIRRLEKGSPDAD